MAFTKGLDGAEIRTRYDHGGPERILDLTLRTGPFGDRYGENPDGLTLEKLKAASRRHQLRPDDPAGARGARHLRQQDPAGAAVPARRPAAAGARGSTRAPDDLVLVSRRHLRSNNSWLHNVGPLMKGKDRCTLLMHDEDAKPGARSQTATW